MTVASSAYVKAKFRKARIPSRRKRDVKRSLTKTLYETFKSALVDGDAKWVVVHGMPGSGKTSLVSELLWSYPEIEGHHFKRIIWITDGNMDQSGVFDVAKDALALLNPQVILQAEAPTSDVTLRMRLETELECGDRCLIVLDDVWLEKTVRYFDGLKCSFIATTTNTEIFSLLEEESVCFFRVSCDSVLHWEVRQLAASYGISQAEEDLHLLMKSTGSNLALIEKVCKLASQTKSDQENGKMLDLLCRWIENEPLRKISCTSAYQHPDLEAPMRLCFSMVDPDLTAKYENLAVFKANTWTPLEVVSLIWPVDECGCSSEGLEKVEIIANLHSFEQRSLLDHKETLFSQTGNHIIEEADGIGSAYRVHPIVHAYIVHNLMPEKAVIRNPAELLMHRLASAKESLTAADAFHLPHPKRNAELFARFYEDNAQHFHQLRQRYVQAEARPKQDRSVLASLKNVVDVSSESVQLAGKCGA
ncbi:caspase recruitment domain-containing protein [Aphelenchoides avenae]|nr:caspase recruitment domain-containing protein [Aphelenchus avenae]